MSVLGFVGVLELQPVLRITRNRWVLTNLGIPQLPRLLKIIGSLTIAGSLSIIGSLGDVRNLRIFRMSRHLRSLGI